MRVSIKEVCRIDYCVALASKKGLCSKHYQRLMTHGFYEPPSPMERILQKVVINDKTGCWEWTGYSHRSGHGSIRVDGKAVPVYRYVYEFYRGKIPDGMFACHKCDNPSCVNPEHIFIGTPRENSQDAARKGRMERGNKRWCSKLTEQDIRSIRADGRAQRVIAGDYGVDQALIQRIRVGKAWGWVGDIA